MNPEILLATPVATQQELWGVFHKGMGNYLPLGLLSIAGICRQAGFRVQMLDAAAMQISADEFRSHLLEQRPDVIGLGSCYTSLVDVVFRTVRLCRETLPQAKIVIGGVHPTLFPVDTLKACPEADFVVFGEGEFTFVEFVRAVADGCHDYARIDGIAYREGAEIRLTAPRPPIADLDSIPPLPFDLLPIQSYVPPPSNYVRLPTYNMMIQRGCPFRCVYCDARVHGRKVRHYSIDKTIADIHYLIKHHGMRGIVFVDSAFTINTTLAARLCQRMIDEKFDLKWHCYTRVDRVTPDLLALMRAAGCCTIAFGLESGNQTSLDRIRKATTVEQGIQAVKWARHAGLSVIASFILCLPGEDEQMTMNTIRFAKKLKLETAAFFLPVPFPGTELFEMCREEGGLRPNIRWEDFREWTNMSNPLYINPRIGKQRMVEIYNYAMRSFYLSPGNLIRKGMSIRSLGDIRRYLNGFRALSGIFARCFKQ